jgi:thiol-disulfide isomerase/thioredoxin
VSARVGPGRAEVVSTAVVVLLVALAVFALWPRSGGSPTVAEGPGVPRAVAVSDAELAPLRAAAALPPCPAATGAPAGDGPLAGLTIGCLGAAGEVDLGAVTAGRPVLLNLWASWCAPCVEELPVLAEYAARPDAVPVLLVDLDDDPRAALRLLDDLGISLPSALDTGSAVRGALDVPPGLPYTYVVGGDGVPSRVDPPVPFRTADAVAAAVAELSAR